MSKDGKQLIVLYTAVFLVFAALMFYVNYAIDARAVPVSNQVGETMEMGEPINNPDRLQSTYNPQETINIMELRGLKWR